MISLVAIGVAAGLGGLILIFAFIRLFLWLRRRTARNPLPPVQMLAHQRLRQQEIYLSQSNYADHLQALSPTADTPGPHSYETLSSGAQTPDPHRNSEERREAPESSASCSSSRAELVPTETQHDQPISRAASSRHLSTRSSFSSNPSKRGPPHKHISRFDVVLPTPLATEQDLLRTVGQRVSVYDQWTPPLARSASKYRVSTESDASRAGLSRISQDTPPVPPVPAVSKLPSELHSQR